MFNKDIYFDLLNTKRFGKNLFILDETSSTNDYIMEGDFAHGDAVTAQVQTKGKGRSGRVWFDKGNSLIFSLCLSELPVHSLMPFNIMAGYAICDCISAYAPAKLKWPNDCLINNKKVSGMLLESSFLGNGVSKIVFGAGINLYEKEFPADIAGYATSIVLNCGKNAEKEILLAAIMNSIERYYKEYEKGLLKISEMWSEYSANINKKITVHINNMKKELTEMGITDNGELIVKDGEKIYCINTGEIGYDFNS